MSNNNYWQPFRKSVSYNCALYKKRLLDDYSVTGYSVLEIVAAFEKASGVKIPVQFCERRVGDIDENYTSAALAEKELNWKCQYGLEEMCKILCLCPRPCL